MPHKLRKIRKMRGSRTCGYGRVGQHRKSGSKGQRRVGRHKHGWSYILRYEPDYFKKKKLKSLKKIEEKVLSLDDLQEIASRVLPKRASGVIIDLEDMGYTKLLGEGKITLPITVKIPSCSKTALKKIEEAGGKVLTDIEQNLDAGG
ncbi:MAG: uL15 family ribosomal protein [Nitrososphaerota archaeon]|nr:50S ribosomal protein L15 [Candidatus Bathyarchaeota archaeon]MDW8048107.1 uL15 family ribosomal protein [Nitrososphaerota archaeon]